MLYCYVTVYNIVKLLLYKYEVYAPLKDGSGVLSKHNQYKLHDCVTGPKRINNNNNDNGNNLFREIGKKITPRRRRVFIFGFYSVAGRSAATQTN